MIKITQTDYIDFISRSGMSKLSKVKSIFSRPDYHPSFDFYKKLREEFVNYIKGDRIKNDLYIFLTHQIQKKQTRFEPLINGYLKFLGRKKAEWFEPPTATWIYKDLNIKMNPELGVVLNGEKYIIKLYFKDSPLEKGDIAILLEMMESTLSTGIFTGYKCALLDIERSKLRYFKKKVPSVTALIEGEAESFIRIWQDLEKKSA
jgi:hypothetical protein